MIFNKNLVLFAPKLALEELEKHYSLIRTKTSLNDYELFSILSDVKSHIRFISEKQYKSNIDIGLKFCPHKNDTAFFALALTLNCPLWSNDKKLKEQSVVKVFSTQDLVGTL